MNHPHLWLVADDHPETLEAAEDVCRSLGYQVISVGSQEEVFQILETLRPCGLCLDLEIGVKKGSIPRIEVGWTTLDRLGQRYKRDELPVVIMTAHGHDHKHPAKATLMEAAAFVKKPFGGDGDPPLEEILRTVMAKTCEARFPDRCPHLEELSRGKARKAGKPAEERQYKGREVWIHLDGNKEDGLARVFVNKETKPRLIRPQSFRILYRLAHALKTLHSEVFKADVLGSNYNRVVGRARDDLRAKAGLDPRLIENDGEKGYRLSVPPENVTCDKVAVRTLYPDLWAVAPWV